MPDPTKWEPNAQFYLGAVIVIATATVQAVILFNNASYTLNAFGWAFLIIYVSAATCYIVLPWISEYIEDFAHIGWTKAAILGFCFWVTAEEHLHAAHDFKAPEGLSTVASLFTGDNTAEKIAVLLVVAILLAIVEFLHNLHHHGAQLMKKHYRR